MDINRLEKQASTIYYNQTELTRLNGKSQDHLGTQLRADDWPTEVDQTATAHRKFFLVKLKGTNCFSKIAYFY